MRIKSECCRVCSPAVRKGNKEYVAWEKIVSFHIYLLYHLSNVVGWKIYWHENISSMADGNLYS